MLPILCSSLFCAENIFKNGNQIKSNKYKNQWDESNHNSNNYNIYHLPFKVVYKYSKQLDRDSIKGVYQIRTPNKAIGTFLWFMSGIMRRDRKNTT